jgi:hypothetical protein
VHQAIDTIEELLRQGEVALRQKDIAQVQLGVGNRLRIVSLPGSLGPPSVEVEGATQVPSLHPEPSEAIQEVVLLDLTTHLF